LHAICESRFEVVYEVIRATRITLSNNQQGIVFVSASSADHVQTSPAPLAFISALQFFSFAPTKLQISRNS